MSPARQNVSSGAPWEATVGYSRAVRVGSHVAVAGTAAVGSDGKVVGVGDPYAQARFILGKIDVALGQAGASLRDVVRTRIYVTAAAHAEGATRAHGEAFGQIRPAATLVVVSGLMTAEMLVEIEADAILGG
jgi:enamine deaminase RidA (YjgF/YER057c/UK114 family)